MENRRSNFRKFPIFSGAGGLLAGELQNEMPTSAGPKDWLFQSILPLQIDRRGSHR
jgi:hypothetical protein